MKDEMNALVETALLIKAENEKLQESLREVKRLLKSCNTEDDQDLRLTVTLLQGTVR